MSTEDGRHVPTLYQRHGLRPPRNGYYAWDDRDGDVEAALEPFPDHPTIVATLSVVRDNGMHGAIHIDRQQARDIIGWLSAQLNPTPAEKQRRLTDSLRPPVQYNPP